MMMTRNASSATRDELVKSVTVPIAGNTSDRLAPALAPIQFRKAWMQSALVALSAALLFVPISAGAQTNGAHYFVDCSQAVAGDGSIAHPWNRLEAISAHLFQPGDVIAVRRDTRCDGALTLHGAGSPAAGVRLTAYGEGPRPKIVATGKDRQAVLLENGAYWQIDSLDIAGGNTYGLLVTGNEDKAQSNIALRNLVVHDVQGGELKEKDNGLVVFLRGSKGQRFDRVLIDNVVAAHTNQWAGIMMGAGKFDSDDEGYNRDVVIRNSVAHDVFGDGIILFRVRNGLIDSSTAWLTGQQPSETTGTPNAIWTWSCTDCAVRNNEAFLTESPGVDGGAYDIDWATTRNAVEKNYAHDTQGYCMAVFGAGYVTHDAVLRQNLCVNNGMSPRMATLQGAIYIRTWNDGKIDGLTVEKNTVIWNPPVQAAPIVNDEGVQLEGTPLAVRENVIRTSSPNLMRSFGDKLLFTRNRYEYHGTQEPFWNWNGRTWHSFRELQAAGAEKDSELHVKAILPSGNSQPLLTAAQTPMDDLAALPGLDGHPPPPAEKAQLWLATWLDLKLDAEGLFAPEAMARLSVLRTLAREYSPRQLQIVVVVPNPKLDRNLSNALLDLDVPSIRFVRASAAMRSIPTLLFDSQDHVVRSWDAASEDVNAAAIGYVVRCELGAPTYSQMDTRP
jgi:hypothetical protein